MSSHERAAYLQAMGITVWEERTVNQAVPVAANEQTTRLPVSLCGRSDSPWLWVLADSSHVDSALFADIRRAVGDSGACNMGFVDETGGVGLATILEELLVTRVVLFGQDLDPDDLVRQKSCDIVAAPALDLLDGSVAMKRTLWNDLQQLLDFQKL